MESQSAHSRKVVIVGGGLAGLAAAEGLSRAGLKPIVLEARPRLGGRATSFREKHTDDEVDNCQHVSMGCCTNLREFCERVGVAEQFDVCRELTFLDRLGRRSHFASTNLPAPFHLAKAFAGLRYFSTREKLEIGSALRRLAGERRFDGPFETWLVHAGQSERIRRLFWHVVLVSALSDSLDRIATQAARKVFVEGFFANRRAWEVYVPRVGLDQLFGQPVVDALAKRNVEVISNSSARRIERASAENGYRIATRESKDYLCDACIVAVPHHRLEGVLSDELARCAAVDAARTLEPVPITSVHLWFDREVADVPHAVFTDHLSQWMFRKPADDGRHYYQVVISASRQLIGRPQESILTEVLADLATAFPAAKSAVLLHNRVVTEKRAVYSPSPESQKNRPAQRTEIAGMYVAGDWTATGWPATMEGAVLSGYLAAEALLQDFGQPYSLAKPGLRPGWLASLLGFH